jgi:hypothetical protein
MRQRPISRVVFYVLIGHSCKEPIPVGSHGEVYPDARAVDAGESCDRGNDDGRRSAAQGHTLLDYSTQHTPDVLVASGEEVESLRVSVDGADSEMIFPSDAGRRFRRDECLFVLVAVRTRTDLAITRMSFEVDSPSHRFLPLATFQTASGSHTWSEMRRRLPYGRRRTRATIDNPAAPRRRSGAPTKFRKSRGKFYHRRQLAELL